MERYTEVQQFRQPVLPGYLQLELIDGKRLLIGTQEPEALAQAVDAGLAQYEANQDNES